MRRLAVCVAIVAGCARPAAPRFPDPPVDLADRDDRIAARDQLAALPPGPARIAARAALADALAAELEARLAADQPAAAAAALAELASLWQDDPSAFARELAPRAAAVDAVRRARAAFARSGAMIPVLLAIAMLAELEPAARPEHLDELDAALAFADELEIASAGPDATRAQPIAMLGPSVLALPLPWLVDRYAGLVADRQRAVDALVHAGTASLEVVRAQRDVTSAAHRIAIALARAGRALEIHDHLKGATGLGSDPKLDAIAEIAADHPSPATLADLARALHADRDAPDDLAALDVCRIALARFPGDRDLLALAGQLAAGAGRVGEAIALDRAAIHAAPHDQLDPVLASELGELYPRELATLTAAGRFAAAEAIWRELAATARHGEGWAEVAAAAQAALGAGELAAGELDAADRTLHASLARAPSVAADVALATLAAIRGDLPAARRAIAAALALLGDSKRDGVRRAELQHRAADLARRAGDDRAAGDLYLASLRSWTELGDSRELPTGLSAARLLDSGETMWWVGDAPRATSLIVGAVDHLAGSPAGDLPASAAITRTVREAAAFLLAVGRAGDAVDVGHRALGLPAIGEGDAVELALWVVGDARWRGMPADRVATEYLAARTGTRWPAQLAAAATGQRTFASLAPAATTTTRRAALDFAAALFAGDRAGLAAVVARDPARAELARHYLATPRRADGGPPHAL